jgi:two-component system, cell cycle response regulator CpdR
MQVLYVEDNADVRELIEMMLVEAGLHVTACASAEQAQVEFAKQAFDMLVTDVGLPGMRGTGLATRMQQERPDLWVVFCTGYPIEKGLLAWGPRARCLTKPFEPEELQALLQDIRSSVAEPFKDA